MKKPPFGIRFLLFDAPDQEFWMDETNRGNTILPAFANACMWAASNHRIAFSNPYLFSHGNPYNADSFPAYEAIHRTLLALIEKSLKHRTIRDTGTESTHLK